MAQVGLADDVDVRQRGVALRQDAVAAGEEQRGQERRDQLRV
jgi:hypothetical protein